MRVAGPSRASVARAVTPRGRWVLATETALPPPTRKRERWTTRRMLFRKSRPPNSLRAPSRFGEIGTVTGPPTFRSPETPWATDCIPRPEPRSSHSGRVALSARLRSRSTRYRNGRDSSRKSVRIPLRSVCSNSLRATHIPERLRIFLWRRSPGWTQPRWESGASSAGSSVTVATCPERKNESP